MTHHAPHDITEAALIAAAAHPALSPLIECDEEDTGPGAWRETGYAGAVVRCRDNNHPKNGHTLAGEIKRIAMAEGVSPHDYLTGLGFSSGAADHLLAGAGMWDDVRGPLNFR